MPEDDRKFVYLMRGLPSCGKSHRARRLAGNTGLVLETDEYFLTEVGANAAQYDYADELLPRARDWNFDRFRTALAQGRSPIVVDRGNGLNPETRRYAKLAVDHGYEVEFREPDSAWWQELRVLLKFRQYVSDELFDIWAERLAAASRHGHRVPREVIRRWMRHWRSDITVQMILDLDAE